MRAVCILVAILRIANGLIELDLRPIGVEFVSDYERKSGSAATAHFGAMSNDGDRSVGCDGQPHIGVQGGSRFAFSGPQRLRNEARTEDENTGGKHTLQESAAADILDELHAVSFAAWWIAARIL